MELDSWRLVSSIPRDWSNSGFPAAFLFERTQIVFWTFFHSWRNEEAYHLPPVQRAVGWGGNRGGAGHCAAAPPHHTHARHAPWAGQKS